ncbi:MAG: CHRD domain-containing protein [Actinobacteria bacterium]|nr:MAG: CHRD domain-containing protein [Actinomycetota bacterium]
MRTSTALLPLAVASLVAAGCGSSSSSNKTTSGATTATPSGGAKVKPKTYKVKLAGKNEVPAGAPTGSGTAVISVKAKTNQLCWKFSNLQGVTAPKLAHIHQGAAGAAGPVVIPLSTAAQFKSSGCAPAAAGLLAQIEANPKGYYVNIHNAKYPGGVVRAQL